MEEKHLLAGEFGAAAHLSPKALRLYAEQGLLAPAKVDAGSGYRYYTAGQLPRARLIGRLRALGLPLARIGFLADLTPDARALELRGWLRAQRDRLDDRAATVEAMQPSARQRHLVDAVRVRDVPATKVVSRTRTGTTVGLDDFVASAEHDIRAHLRAAGLPDDGGKLIVFEELVTPDCEGRIEVAVACTGPVEPAGDLTVRLMGAHTAAFLPVPAGHEDFPLILAVYDAVEAWTDEQPGFMCGGHSYERYPGDGAMFDVVLPIIR